MTAVPMRMVRGLYVPDTPPWGGGGQPEDHERDRLDDDSAREAGARYTGAYRPHTLLDDLYYPLDVAHVFVVPRGVEV